MTTDKLMAGARWLLDMSHYFGNSKITPTQESLVLMAGAIERDVAVRKQLEHPPGAPPMLQHNGHWVAMLSPELSDGEVATRVRMLMRDEIDHEYVCTLARDRIMSLSQRLSAFAPIAAERDAPAYLIWSNEHRAWWRPGCAGYTTYLVSAGRYSQAEALQICRDARGGWTEGNPPPEIPVREADALASVPR